jgi:SET domain-containing protein
MLHPNILIRKSSIHELGLFAEEHIPKGQRIWELDQDAEILRWTDVKHLPRRMWKQLYQCGAGSYALLTDGSQYMNHCCNPNTWPNGDTAFDAMVDISPREEVTCDYATFLTDMRWKGMVCHCNSRNCRTRITSLDCLNPEFQSIYVGHLPSWVTQFINEHI